MATHYSLSHLAHELGHAVLVNRKAEMDEAVRQVNQEMSKRGAISSGMRATKIDQVLVECTKAAFDEIVQKYATALEGSDARFSKLQLKAHLDEASRLVDGLVDHAKAVREAQKENRATPDTTRVFLARLQANRDEAVARIDIEFGRARKRDRLGGWAGRLGIPGAIVAAVVGLVFAWPKKAVENLAHSSPSPVTTESSMDWQRSSRSVVGAIQELIGASQRYFRMGNYSAGGESPERAITQLDNVIAENEAFLDSVSAHIREPGIISIKTAIRRADETILVAASAQKVLDNGERAVMTRQEVSTRVRTAIHNLQRIQTLVQEYRP